MGFKNNDSIPTLQLHCHETLYRSLFYHQLFSKFGFTSWTKLTDTRKLTEICKQTNMSNFCLFGEINTWYNT